MNNSNTDLTTILLNKFPEVIDKKDEIAYKNLRYILTLIFNNESLKGEYDKYLHFENLITRCKSIAGIKDSETNKSIQFVPYNDENVNEAIAFSICNSYFTCIRINKEGMFIEKQDLHAYNLKTKYYDNMALKEIIGNYLKKEYEYNDNKTIEKVIDDEIQNNTLKLIRILQVMDYSIDNLSDMIAKKYNINPDFLVEADSYDDLSQKLQVIFSKNNISSDSYIVEFPTPISLYPKYLTFMANQGLYIDNPIQIKRKTRKQFKKR